MNGATALARMPVTWTITCRRWWRASRPWAASRSGLGVGLDLSPYYDRSLVVDLSEGTPLGAFLEVAGLLGARRRSRAP